MSSGVCARSRLGDGRLGRPGGLAGRQTALRALGLSICRGGDGCQRRHLRKERGAGAEERHQQQVISGVMRGAGEGRIGGLAGGQTALRMGVAGVQARPLRKEGGMVWDWVGGRGVGWASGRGGDCHEVAGRNEEGLVGT